MKNYFAAAPAESEPCDCRQNESSALLYTSGTTGKPWAMLTHRNIYINALNAI